MNEYIAVDEDALFVLTWHFYEYDASQSAVVLESIGYEFKPFAVVQNANDTLLYKSEFRLHERCFELETGGGVNYRQEIKV